MSNAAKTFNIMVQDVINNFPSKIFLALRILFCQMTWLNGKWTSDDGIKGLLYLDIYFAQIKAVNVLLKSVIQLSTQLYWIAAIVAAQAVLADYSTILNIPLN